MNATARSGLLSSVLSCFKCHIILGWHSWNFWTNDNKGLKAFLGFFFCFYWDSAVERRQEGWEIRGKAYSKSQQASGSATAFQFMGCLLYPVSCTSAQRSWILKKKVFVDLLEKLAGVGSLYHLAMLLRPVHERVLINEKNTGYSLWLWNLCLDFDWNTRLQLLT